MKKSAFTRAVILPICTFTLLSACSGGSAGVVAGSGGTRSEAGTNGITGGVAGTAGMSGNGGSGSAGTGGEVGANEPVFDDHDVRVVKETLNGTYTYKGSLTGIPGLPDSEVDVGGYENYPNESRAATWDSDADGLPDWWETAFSLNPKSAKGDYSDANIDTDGNGYTQLEEYLA